MNRLYSILDEFLREATAPEPLKLGKERRALVLSEDDRRKLFERLLGEAQFNNRLVVAVTVLHFLLFTLAVWLVYYYRESPNTVAVILGGSVLSLLAITRSLSGLWRDKWKVDFLITILPSLTPEEALTVIKSIHFAEKAPTLPPAGAPG